MRTSRQLSSLGLLTAAAALLALAGPGSALAQSEEAPADVAVAMTADVQTIPAAQNLTYEVVITNNGPSPTVTGLVVDLDDSVDPISADDQSCGVRDDVVTCTTFPPILPQGTYRTKIVVRPTQEGTITSVARATPLLPTQDPDVSNNESAVTTTVTEAISGPRNCGGRKPTVVGDADGGVVSGTPDRDVIVGGPGNDRIRSGAGRDIVCGLGGNDRIATGAGKDVLKGGAGDDELRGAAGNDKLAGAAGDDRLSGGSGKDSLRGSGGSDRIKGGGGDDRARGGGGDDDISGAGGDDRLAGQGGDDDLNGRGGDDRLAGGGGSNSLNGGNGKDRCRGNGRETNCERG